jgi:hypothetical protein
MRRWLRSSVGFFLVVASILGAYNVLSDNADVERLAQQVACDAAQTPPRGGAAAPAVCSASKTMMERTPIAQSFEYATGKKQVRIRCMRSAVLVGEYACEVR